MPALRRVAALILLLTLAVLAARGVGQLLPPAPILGYVTAVGSADRLVFYDVRTRVQQTGIQSASVRGARWLPNGEGVLVSVGGAWQVVELRGDQRPPAATEQAGTTFLPVPDWSQYASLRRGSLRLYDVRPGENTWQALAGGMRLGLRDAVWSPDGTQLAVTLSAVEPSYELRQIGVINRQSRQLRLVENRPAVYTQMRWSPDGTRLAYIDVPRTIATIHIETSAQTRWVTMPETVDALAWLPTGRLTFATRDGRLYALDAPGETPRLLTDALDANTQLAAAPNGDWLAVSSGTLTRHTLYLLNLQTGHLRTIARDLPASDFLAWQPR